MQNLISLSMLIAFFFTTVGDLHAEEDPLASEKKSKQIILALRKENKRLRDQLLVFNVKLVKAESKVEAWQALNEELIREKSRRTDHMAKVMKNQLEQFRWTEFGQQGHHEREPKKLSNNHLLRILTQKAKSELTKEQINIFSAYIEKNWKESKSVFEQHQQARNILMDQAYQQMFNATDISKAAADLGKAVLNLAKFRANFHEKIKKILTTEQFNQIRTVGEPSKTKAQKALPDLIIRLDQEDYKKARKAAQAIIRLFSKDERTVPLLIHALADKSPSRRQWAAYALGKLGSAAQEAVPALTVVLASKNIYASGAARDAIYTLKANAVAGLTVSLKHKDRSVRYVAAQFLGRLRETSSSAIPALIEAMHIEGDSDSASNIAEALGGIGAPAVPALRDTLKNKDAKLQRLAAVGLWRMTDRKECIEAASAAAPELMQVFLGNDRRAAKSAVFALQKFGRHAVSVTDELVEILDHDDKWKKWSSASILHAIGSEAIPVLIQALEKASPTKKIGILMALSGMKKSATYLLPYILKLYGDSNKEVRERAADCLKLLGRTGVIIKAFNRESWAHAEALIEEWQEIMEKERRLAKTPEAIYEIHKHMARTFIKIEKPELAIKNWLSAREAMKSRKNSRIATLHDIPILEIGKIYKNQGNLDKAVEYFERFRKTNQDKSEIFALIKVLCPIYEAQQQFGKARLLYKSVLRKGYGKNWASPSDLKRLQGEVRKKLQVLELKEQMPNLAKMLGDENYASRQKAYRGFETLGKEAIPFLMKMKNHSDMEVRAAVQRLLAASKVHQK